MIRKHYNESYVMLCALVAIATIANDRYLVINCSAQEFSMARHGAPIYLPVSILSSGHKAYRFLFVTGSNHHFIDVSLRKFATKLRSNESDKLRDSNREILELYNGGYAAQYGISLKAGSISLRGPESVHVRDLQRLRHVLGEEFFGVIGAPFLRDRLVQFDFDGGTLRVISPCDFNANNWTSRLLATDRLGRPLVPNIQVGDRAEAFLVNTAGSWSVELHKWLFDALVRSGHITVLGNDYLARPDKDESARFGRLDRIAWGPFCHHDVGVLEGEQNVLGLSYLARYVIAMDVSNQHIYLRKGKGYDGTDCLNQTGIHVWKINGAIVICKVDRHSVAEEAGIRGDDQLIAINGRKTSGVRLCDVRKLLREAGGKITTLTLQRDKETINIPIEVKLDRVRQRK